MKNAGEQAKLKGEIVILERELKGRQKAFGVQLFDLLVSSDSHFIVKTPSIFHANEEKIRVPFESCKADVDSLLATKQAHEHELDLVQAKKDSMTPAYSTQDKLNNAGKWMSNTGKEGKIQAQIALLERQIRQRKEQFGLEVFHLVEMPKESGGIKSGVSNQLSKFSQKEKLIEQVVEQAKKDVAVTSRQIRIKEDRIISLGGSVKVNYPDA